MRAIDEDKSTSSACISVDPKSPEIFTKWRQIIIFSQYFRKIQYFFDMTLFYDGLDEKHFTLN